MISPEEYESLPPSVRSKYFSCVERLRIAQTAASQKRKKQPVQPQPPVDRVRSKTVHSILRSPPPSSPRLAHFRASCQLRSEARRDEDEALRFLALPEKVKRSSFTQEELVLLTERSGRALGLSLTADDGVTRCTAYDRSGSTSSRLSQTSPSDDIEALDRDWPGMDPASAMSSEPGACELETLKLYVRQRHGSESSAHPSSAPSAVEARLESRRKSFSRKGAGSLAPIPLPPRTLLPALPALPPASALRSVKSVRPAAPPPSPVDSAADTNYYKDTSARSKLREYLASPEKFDEFLEFGFRPDRSKPSVSARGYKDEDLQEESDELSVADSDEDDEDDDEDMSSTKSPVTPAGFDTTFGGNTTPHSSVDSGVALPASGKVLVRSLSPELDGREMTLRMTLTKPELRAPEAELYSFQRKEVSGVDVETKDPLALDALHVCEDHTGAHGAFAVRNNGGPKGGLKKAWMNLRGR